MWSSGNLDGPSTGGFMDESYAVPNQSTNTERKNPFHKTMKPITINCFLDYENDISTYSGADVGIFRIMAIVKSIKASTTKVVYELEDHTGTTTAYRMISDPYDPKDFKLNRYYKIIGTAKTEIEKLFVIKMFPVDNYSELLAFRLELMNNLLTYENRQDGLDIDDPAGSNGSDSTIDQWNRKQNSNNGLSTDQAAVFKYIKDNDSVQGVNRNEIKSSFPPSLTSKIDIILTFLVGEGHIYTTTTDDYFKAT